MQGFDLSLQLLIAGASFHHGDRGACGLLVFSQECHVVAVSRGVDANADGSHVVIINAGRRRSGRLLLLFSFGCLLLSDCHQEDFHEEMERMACRSA